MPDLKQPSPAGPGTAPPLRALSTLAVMGAMPALAALHAAATGTRVTADFAPTVALLDRLRAGEPTDLAILTAEGLAALERDGTVLAGSRVDVAVSLVGVAVRSGAPHPAIGTAEDFRRALLDAPSVAYSRIGASGILFARVIGRLGIADAVNAKARVVASGFTAELAASGEVALAVQQVSELLAVPGSEVVGPLPAELQEPALFSAGVLREAAQPGAARHLLRIPASAAAAAALRASGLELPRRA